MKKIGKKFQIFLLFTLITLEFSLNSCNSGRYSSDESSQHLQQPSNGSSDEATALNGITTEDESADFQETIINPLTGLSISDEHMLARRPVMVKVANFPRAGRPHAGLSFADIVFDYYIGYGTNRFLAVFYGQDSPQIGPVRSGRRVDAQLVNMYEGILGYGSADEDTDAILVQALGARAISNLEAPCPIFCGTDTHSVVGVFANSTEITQFAQVNSIDEGITPDLPGTLFNSETPAGGKKAEKITILFNYYNRGEWHYDPPSGKYLRWIEDMEDEDEVYDMIPLVDRVTNEQLAFSNVIILFAHYIEYAPSVHDVDIQKNTEGKRAVFFRDGQMFAGTWKTVNDTDPIQLFNTEGNPMPLKPGNSWIVITEEMSIFHEPNPGDWEMFFFLP